MHRSLDDILAAAPWDRLPTARGFAQDVPDAVRNLTSIIKESRTKAYWSIDNNVVLQGELYDSAFYVIQPLILLVQSGAIDGNYELFNLLFEIAYGSSDRWITPPGETTSMPLADLCKSTILRYSQLFVDFVRKSDDMPAVESACDLLFNSLENFNTWSPIVTDIAQESSGAKRELLLQKVSEYKE